MKDLLNEKILVFCMNYFYYGKLLQISEDHITLTDCYQVFETGSYKDHKFKDAQFICPQWNIMLSSIESFGISPKHP